MENHTELNTATDVEGTAPMTAATDNTGRNPDGRFAKGNSGNTGRPRGSRSRATLAAEALLDGEVEALTRKLIDKALEGDSAALARLAAPMAAGGRVMARRRQRVRLQDGLKLDLNRLIRQHVMRPGANQLSTIRWSYRHTDKEIASGRITAEMTQELRGRFRIELGDLDQWIELVAVARPYGGRQWYFLCPRTERRASVLWKPPGARSFACRQAWGRQVAYGSQFQSPYQRASSAAQGIRYRLGEKEDVSPPRPKGMHRRTYEKIMRRYEAHETVIYQDLVAALGRLMR
jgi:Family of unknown function (DUF5681)